VTCRAHTSRSWRIGILYCLTALATVTGPGCGDNGVRLSRKSRIHPGKILYQQHCSLCHGKAGEGHAADHAPAIGSDHFLRLVDNAFIFESIAKGRPGTPMSAWSERYGGPLSDPMIREVVAYLRTRQQSPPARLGGGRLVGNIRNGEKLFTEHCAECHSGVPTSAQGPDLGNPAFLSLAGDTYIAATIRLGRPGTPMESFAEKLSEKDIRDVTAFIRSRGRPPQGPSMHAGVTEIWSDLDAGELVRNGDGPAPQFTLRDPWYVSAEQLDRELTGGARMILLDARAPSDWHVAHLPGAWPVPFYADESLLDRIPKDGTWIVFYCGCPHAAADRAAHRLKERGYENLAVLDEGFYHWQEQGYPLVQAGVLTAPHAAPPKEPGAD
jgi:mono/diheme cytochrome c family protein/rhodanese-related sulfurtransferase